VKNMNQKTALAELVELGLLQPHSAFPHGRLRLGQTEAAVVEMLAAQRERYRQTGGATPLCLSLAEIEARTGIGQASLQRAISRLNAKLIVQSWLITCLHATSCSGRLGYTLFRLPEVLGSAQESDYF
jgi:hypothetical protein